MKMGQIVTAEDKLELAQLIFNNTFKQLTAVPHVPTKPNQYALQKKLRYLLRLKSQELKRLSVRLWPRLPKPLPKPKPIALTATQIKNKQLKNQKPMLRPSKVR